MLKRVALTLLAMVLGSAARVIGAPEDEPPESPPLNSRAVMTGDQVIRILDETVDWYRMLGVQQQSATQPSDLLILYANRQTADRVVALAFEIARANAELLSSEAESHAGESADPASSPQTLLRNRRELDARRAAIQSDIASTQRRLATARGPDRTALQGQIEELQSELDLVNARRNLLDTMVQFAHESDANGSGASALKEHIDAIAASIPAAASASPPGTSTTGAAQPGAAAPASAGTPLTPAGEGAARRLGIWDLGVNVLRLTNKLSTIDEVDRRTEALQETFAQTRNLPEAQIKALSARGDALKRRPATTDPAALERARDEYDTLAWLFQQTSAILVPLSKAGVLLDQYGRNLDNWRDATKSQYGSALKALAARVALLALFLVALFGAAELWRRAVFRYVHEARRRHQLLLVRRIALWLVALAIVGIAFASEVGSLATFAGLLTAGLAVAMQSVLVSIVGYFFLVGKYGLRVGDRVQIGSVTGEVIDLGLVRLHLMELGPQYGPTGRVVAFANSVVFQASGGIFKQIPGVSFAWRDITLALPEGSDYTALKEELQRAAEHVLDDYRDELQRQTRELQKASSSSAADQTQAHVQLRFSADAVEAIVRYPVQLQRAAEIEERMSRELLGVIRAAATGPARLSAQPAT